MTDKPLGRKNYGSIGHLPNSRLGPGDHSVNEGQARICTEKTRDRFDEIIVQEKLDGSNVGVANVDGEIVALGRAGYLAQTSPHEQHQLFAHWVRENESRFRKALAYGQRICGEWLAQAHGTIYKLEHEPFVAFDLMTGPYRFSFDDFLYIASVGDFVTPHLIHRGDAISVEEALSKLGEFGHHGAQEPAEGIVYRVERHRAKNDKRSYPTVDFLAKWVRPDKVDGKYFDGDIVWNWRPK